MPIESQLIEALRGPGTVYLRLALGVAFLSAVADRFGLWGPAGTKNVAWGDFAHFTQYTGQLNPWAPAALIPTLAWASTGAELVLGAALILGLFTRWAALLSGILLLLFAGGISRNVWHGHTFILAGSGTSGSGAGLREFLLSRCR